MNTEIKTGGPSAPRQPGDLVTAVHAPPGAPTWVGEIVRQDGGWGNCWWVHRLGSVFADTARGHDLRALTDREVVGLAAMLSGGRWAPFSGASWSLLGSGEDDAVVMLAAPHGWRCLPTDGVEIVGHTTSVEAGITAASRALITYTIRGRP